MKRIRVDELKKYIDEKQDVLIINVLSEKYFNENKIPTSINIPFKDNNNFTTDVAQKIKSKYRKIVLYCKNVDCDLSGKAAKLLEDSDFLEIEVYEGGIDGWLENTTRD